MQTTQLTTSPVNAASCQAEDAPNVSIIIVNYNGRSYLDTCLQSVLAYSGPDIELILVDNQSTDGSAEYVMTAYPQVQVIRNHNNGYGGGNNVAARLARGRFLV
ncbi:MAG: glycosyltransferase, partial [Anaerolineales bacterium]|nr:glycosyltransferase [Anaerolineales bacterium]